MASRSDSVTFHEVGAINSIVDIVAARAIDCADPRRSLDIGAVADRIGADQYRAWRSARTRASRGSPPARPARHRRRRSGRAGDADRRRPRAPPHRAQARRSGGRICRLSRSGVGFGARTLPGVSNCLRALAFDEATAARRTAGPIGRRQLAVITFEVDDQCPEDLAAGLDHIRALHGVFDVTQSSVVGKKGRMAAHVQVLVAPLELENVIVACFEETTTIGLRYQLTEGAVLRRRLETVEIGGRKIAGQNRRPAGRSCEAARRRPLTWRAIAAILHARACGAKRRRLRSTGAIGTRNGADDEAE